MRLGVANTGLTIISWNDRGEARLDAFNETSHLEGVSTWHQGGSASLSDRRARGSSVNLARVVSVNLCCISTAVVEMQRTFKFRSTSFKKVTHVSLSGRR
jgi:hypothetical protein